LPTTLEKLIDRHARYRGDRLALVFGQQRLTWAQFNKAVNRLANALQARGIGKDDKVATALPNRMELLLTIGAPLQQQYKEALNAVIPGRFYELYGLTKGFVTILDRSNFDQMPRNVAGKTLKNELKENYLANQK